MFHSHLPTPEYLWKKTDVCKWMKIDVCVWMRRDVARASGWKNGQGWRLHVQGWMKYMVCLWRWTDVVRANGWETGTCGGWGGCYRYKWMKMGLFVDADGCCTYMWMENVDVVFLETRRKPDKERQAEGQWRRAEEKERSGEGTVRVHECIAQWRGGLRKEKWMHHRRWRRRRHHQ